MYRARESSARAPQAGEEGLSQPKNGFADSRDCTRAAATGSPGIASEFTVVHSCDVPLDFTYGGWARHLGSRQTPGMTGPGR
jgi:hypothetical protein